MTKPALERTSKIPGEFVVWLVSFHDKKAFMRANIEISKSKKFDAKNSFNTKLSSVSLF